MAFGVSFSVKADIGVSPISCVPYIYSLGFPLSIGEFTILLNALFMLIQIAILGKKYNLIQLIQLPAIILFGYCIDAAMILVENIVLSNYIEQLILCLISCVVLAFGILLVVKTRLTYLPLEGLVVVISQVFKKEFGKVKISMDSIMVIIGVISSFIFLNQLVGIREGSIIAALSIGALIKFFNTNLPFIEKWLTNEVIEKSNIENISNKYNETFIITISREYGSGGHEIGQFLAKELKIPFYDKELIDLTAEKTGYTPEYIQENEQKLTNSLLYDLYEQNFTYVNDELPPKDVLFLIQSKIIRDICMKESCIIVGRCANFILKDHPNCVNIFIHANNEYRKEKINKVYGVNPPFTDNDLKDSDEQRANYCTHFTKKDWRDVTNYHITLDSSLYGSKESAKKLIKLIKSRNL
ncbi:hypothetical protein CP965_01130 [Halarcobacter mediterraneus]|uniref:Cytidylate kinase n=2 Tax=Halarcobacter mediterraneus TaxID=2023153 RepID=A0A4Q1B044_9BACT|nr:hypothetical protein CP965_01130 [Halarcobacter mediterraneus]